MCLHHKICSCTTNYFSYITSLHMFFCNLKKWPFFRPPKKDLKIVFITLQVKKFFMLWLLLIIYLLSYVLSSMYHVVTINFHVIKKRQKTRFWAIFPGTCPHQPPAKPASFSRIYGTPKWPKKGTFFGPPKNPIFDDFLMFLTLCKNSDDV